MKMDSREMPKTFGDRPVPFVFTFDDGLTDKFVLFYF